MGPSPHSLRGKGGGLAKALSGLGIRDKHSPGDKMSDRLVAAITQPCILCEGDLEEWLIYRDEPRGIERIERTRLKHDCPVLRDLVAERYRAFQDPYRP